MTGTRYKYIFFFLLSLSSLVGFSQSGGINFEDAYEGDSLYAVRNAVKLDPLQIAIGDIEVFYERIIAEGFSLEVGAGITRRNYAAGWNDYSLDNLGRNVDIKTGYAFTFAVRKYLQSSDELSGPYVSLGMKFLKYETDFEVVDTTGVLTSDVFTDIRNYTNVEGLVGYQLLPQTSNLFMDVYVGVAYRKKDFDVVHSSAVNDPESYTIEHETENDFAFRVGVKIGWGF